jgi:hypothetical protein
VSFVGAFDSPAEITNLADTKGDDNIFWLQITMDYVKTVHMAQRL